MPALVRFENVSKCYRLGAGQRDLRELISSLPGRLLRRASEASDQDEFWALKDVSFAVDRGSALGIIGSNGAGKTTTLKILSRVTKPTSGHVQVDGRMSSLIELGAGFHPDLTGRENIYLNGAILGMKKREVDGLFDRIVGFAELERFIDTPVKRYSSGMYARLGFAVAAHVSPDILLVDEVLSVGDLSFQMKCAERMKELRAQGATIILVSHNMRTVDAICDSCLLLNHGRVAFLGSPREAIDVHMALSEATSARGLTDGPTGPGRDPGKAADILRVELLDDRGNPRESYEIGETLVARIHYVAHRRIEAPLFSAGFYRVDGLHACSNTSLGELEPEAIEGPGMVELIVPNLPLVPNTYGLVTLICERRSLRPYAMEQLVSFRVRCSGLLIDEAYGVFLPDFHWRLLADTRTLDPPVSASLVRCRNV